jgi:hypothetical protein
MTHHITRSHHRPLSERQREVVRWGELLDDIQERFHHAMIQIRCGRQLSDFELDSLGKDCDTIHDFRSQMDLDPSPIPMILAPQINRLYGDALTFEKRFDNKCLRVAMLIIIVAGGAICFLGAVLSGAELIRKYY